MPPMGNPSCVGPRCARSSTTTRTIFWPSPGFASVGGPGKMSGSGSVTISGARCRSAVSGHVQLSSAQWKTRQGDLCAVHAGDSAAEAREVRRRFGRD